MFLHVDKGHDTLVRATTQAKQGLDELVTKKDLQIAPDQVINPVKADLLVLKWAIGLNTALCLLILGKLFNH